MFSIADVKPLVWGYKFTREIARRMPVFRGECAAIHPKFAEGSSAGLILEGQPLALSAPKVVYSPEDDQAIEDYVRAQGTSIV